MPLGACSTQGTNFRVPIGLYFSLLAGGMLPPPIDSESFTAATAGSSARRTRFWLTRRATSSPGTCLGARKASSRREMRAFVWSSVKESTSWTGARRVSSFKGC
jgi:hypothetical protein